MLEEATLQTKLDRSQDAPPLYRQITRRLLEYAQLLPAGSQFPTDKELTLAFGVSRITVTQAIKSLTDTGYLERVQGKGTYVRRPLFERTELRLNSFSEDTVRMGYRPGAKLIAYEIREPDEDVRELLELENGEKTLYLERLMSADEKVIALLYTHIPLKMCMNFEEWFSRDALDESSLYGTFEKKCGYRLARARETIQAVNAAEREAKPLEISPGDSVLWIRRLTYVEDDRPIEYSNLVYRGDRYKIDLTAIRD